MALTLRARLLTPTGPDTVRWLDDAVVVVRDGSFVHIGPYDGRPVVDDLRPGVLLPGFVDAHIHFPQLRVIGSASGPLLPWLRASVMPEEARYADPEHARTCAERFASLLAASGTTLAMVYGSVHAAASHTLLEVLDRRGLRAIVGPVLMDTDVPAELVVPTGPALAGLADLADRWHGHDDGRLEVAAIPRFALSCTADLMREAGALARERGLWVSTHLSENTDECAVAVERFGTTDYLEVYEDLGLVHDRAIYAHCIHLSTSEWDRLASAGARVAHCPDSNDFLGSGGMPVAEVMSRDIPLAIGTDVAAGRSARVGRILASTYDNALRQQVLLSPERLLWLGTRGGALALHQPRVGALEVGLQADMICVDVPDWAEDADAVLAWTLLCHDAPLPRRTWVRGHLVWDRLPWQAAGGAWPWEGDPRARL